MCNGLVFAKAEFIDESYESAEIEVPGADIDLHVMRDRHHGEEGEEAAIVVFGAVFLFKNLQKLRILQLELFLDGLREIEGTDALVSYRRYGYEAVVLHKVYEGEPEDVLLVGEIEEVVHVLLKVYCYLGLVEGVLKWLSLVVLAIQIVIIIESVHHRLLPQWSGTLEEHDFDGVESLVAVDVVFHKFYADSLTIFAVAYATDFCLVKVVLIGNLMLTHELFLLVKNRFFQKHLPFLGRPLVQRQELVVPIGA